MGSLTSKDACAVVCTKNSLNSIENCLKSLKQAGVAEIIVVDAASTDGTAEVAEKYADLVLSDSGIGLGNARNTGIARSTKQLILNVGSDNVFPDGELQKMIDYLEDNHLQGVSAQTYVLGSEYLARGMNAWRAGRFVEGECAVIGTPTLFFGDMLRANPYDARSKFSDDSELCERWAQQFDARFAISDAQVVEIGKTSWSEIKIRARMYGMSDHEIYSRNQASWTTRRKFKSLTHPLRVDLVKPLSRLPTKQVPVYVPFLLAFSFNRYLGWLRER